MNGKTKIFPKISSAVFAGLAFFFFGLNLSLALDLEPATGPKDISTDWSSYDNIYINDGVTVTLAAGEHDLGSANLIVNDGGTIKCSSLIANSASSVATGTGSKTFTVAAGLGFSAGQEVIINNRVAQSTLLIMEGVVTSYSSTTLVVNVTSAVGSSTHDSWTIALKPSVTITTMGNVTINSGGVISALGMGYEGETSNFYYAAAHIDPYGPAPSKSISQIYGGGGGGHGGIGAAGAYGEGGSPVYGSDSKPVTLGSGGAGGGLNEPKNWTVGGAGGGAIKLNVYGTLTNNGIITSDGGPGYHLMDPPNYPAGGGAGGSVWINAGTLLGSGVVSAKGSPAFGGGDSAHYAGGGGGGRIACYAGGDNLITYNVSGGASTPGSSGTAGAAGTIYIRVLPKPTNLGQYQSDGVIPIAAGGRAISSDVVFKFLMDESLATSTTLTPQVEIKEVGVPFDETMLISGDPVDFSGAPVIVAVYYTLPASSEYHWRARVIDADGNASFWVNFGTDLIAETDLKGPAGETISVNPAQAWSGDKTFAGTLRIASGVTVTVNGQATITADNIIIEEGASINANGTGQSGGIGGWSGTAGAGLGGGLFHGEGGGGASHAGKGGNGSKVSGEIGGTTIYGDIMEPTSLGSGGGGGGSSGGIGGKGGGAIKIQSATLINNGSLSADGQSTESLDRSGGGGSGGSIWIVVDSISGSGSISAKGGNAGEGASAYNYCGGGGGGGRISINPANTDLFIGDITVEPGSGGQGGIAGTVYRAVPENPASVTLSRNIVWNSQITGYTSQPPITGIHSFSNLTIPANITLSAGVGTGTTVAQSENTARRGQEAFLMGGGGASTQFCGAGAGHGGGGGDSGDKTSGGIAYPITDFPEKEPVYFGSSGAAAYGASAKGGYGGGAIKLVVSDTLSISGVLSANGQNGLSGGSAGGGGSGGSIWIDAGTISGTNPTIRAIGGTGGNNSNGGGGGGGAGGRLAFSFNHWSATGTPSVSVAGGLGGNKGTWGNNGYPGENGTIDGLGAMTVITSLADGSYHKASPAITISGTAYSPASEIIAVQVLIKNDTDGRYWNGNWNSTQPVWLDAAVTPNPTTANVNWVYSAPSPTWTTDKKYIVTTRANDGVLSPGISSGTVTFYYDTTAPAISSVTLNPSSGYLKLGDTVTITVTPSSAEPNNGLLTPSAITFNGRSITLTPASSNSGPFIGTYTVTDGDANITNPSATGVTLTDSAGNVSGEGSSAASTLVIDSYKPVISSVALSPASGYRKIGDTVTITATVTHNEANLSGAAKVLSSSTATFNGQSVAVATGPTGASSPYTFTYIYTVAEGDGDAVNAEASNIVITDASGNASDAGSSSSNTVIIDSTKPVVSDAHISISSSPANGVVYLVGEQVTARWDNSASGDNNSDIASVTCDFSALGGDSAVAMSESNGIYTASYTVATNSITGTHTIAVTAVDTAGNYRITADSTQITIASGSLTLTSPNTAVSYKAGTTQQITWTAGGDVSRVSLMYSTDSGANYKIINTVGSITGNNSYSWTVPSDVTSSARVKVEDAVIPQVYSASSVDFTIAYPAITITSPNGGESWPAGSTQNITWTTDSSAVTHVKLEYSIDGGSSWNLITPATVNTGSYSWTLNNLFAIDTVSVRATGLSRNQALTLGGTAAGKVSSSAWIEDGYKTLALQALTDFSAGDTLVVSGIKFDNFSASDVDALRLSVDGGYATDDKTIKVLAPSVYSGGLGDGWARARLY